MDEDRAAAPGHPGPPVVVDFNNEIIEMVGPAQTVAWVTITEPDRAIITAVGRILAPGVVGPDWPDRQRGERPDQPVGAPP